MQPERPVQTTLAFHASRIVIDAGVLMAMASMSLAFVVSDVGNRSALHADAFPTMLLLLPVFAISLVPDHTRPIHPIAGWASLALGLAALPYAIVKLLDARILADTLDGSLGFGAYLLIIGVATTIAGIGIGLYRDIKGLPTGGTPGRSAAYETRSSRLRAPGTAQRLRRKKEASASGPAKKQSSPDQTPPEPTPRPEATPAEPPESPTAQTRSQPDIVFSEEGAPAREADAIPESETTAERADAAIDDHFMSMFDDEEPPDRDE